MPDGAKTIVNPQPHHLFCENGHGLLLSCRPHRRSPAAFPQRDIGVPSELGAFPATHRNNRDDNHIDLDQRGSNRYADMVFLVGSEVSLLVPPRFDCPRRSPSELHSKAPRRGKGRAASDEAGGFACGREPLGA